MKPRDSLESWRNYFRRADSDIFEIIRHAITVAATDCPKEFKSRRDKIAELLFSCKINRCTGCDHLELAIPDSDEDGQRQKTRGGDGRHGDCDGDEEEDGDFDGFEAGGSKESKVNSSGGDNHIDDMNPNNNQIVSNYSYSEAEALDDEIEEASQVIGEVSRIKHILLNNHNEPDCVLLESLRRLQLMDLTVDILQTTEIGKAVNGLRKHPSSKICQLVKTLVGEWKELVHQWVNTTKDITEAERTPDSASPSVVEDEEGLPSPPLDEGAFFTTEPTGIELLQFFDGVDDELGNPRNCGEFNKNRENDTIKRKPHGPNGNEVVRNTKNKPMRPQEAYLRPSKRSIADSTMPRTPLKQSTEYKPVPLRNHERVPLQKKPVGAGGQQDKTKCPDDEARFEFAKRKLQESYQQHENAKKQRTIQVLETIPKPAGPTQRPQFKKPGAVNRNWAHSRK